ncbi:MAG: GspH/FimT family pseudopilin, partial [Candidatus Sumerlaeota bacterium]|nr:GspH/FimT family pseudopilin [Candidatus Sumerlaeota bacterium]
ERRGFGVMRVRNTTGFSMIELIVVVTVAMLLTAIGLASYAGLRSNREQQAAVQRVVATLSAARQTAIATNGRYQVYFLLPTKEFWVDELDASGNVARRQITNPGSLPEFMSFESVTVEGVAPTPGAAEIRFWPDGHSDSATLYLVRTPPDPAASANVATIKIFGPTGMTQSFLGERR